MNTITRVKTSKFQQRFLVILVLIAVLAASVGGAQAAPAVPATLSLSGKVTLQDGTTAISDAWIVATQSGQSPQKVAVDGTGSYSLTPPAPGDWQVTVLPNEASSTTSPTWVYTGTVQTAHFSQGVNAVTLDFQVSQATAKIEGQLLVPTGEVTGTNFTGANEAWVRAANQEGQGNRVKVNPDGTFSVSVLSGDVLLRLGLKNPLWAANPVLVGAVWNVVEGQTRVITDTDITGASYLQLFAKSAQITGVVTDGTSPVANIPVRAARVDGSETALTTSSISGTYSLNVLQGVWMVWAVPNDDQAYVSAELPHKVVLGPTDTKVQELMVFPADVTISGSMVDASNPSQVVPGLRGRVLPTYLDQDGIHWREFSQGALIANSTYNLKLSSKVATTYRLHAAFTGASGYTQVSAPKITVNAGDHLTGINLPVAANNSSISGAFLDHGTGQPKTGLPGAVYGASDGGAFDRARVNPLDGSYRFDVAASDLNGNGGTFWWLRAFVDPTTGYMVQRPRTQKVFLPYNNGQGVQIPDIDFTVAKIDAVIFGHVTDVQGNPVAGARVSVWEQNAPAGAAFNRWTLTGEFGNYALRVTAGSYQVRADYRLDGNKNLISPQPVNITVASGDRLRQDLRFRKADAWIEGAVTYNGAPHDAMVRAYSDTGAHTWTLANPITGRYILPALSNDTWHIQAASEEGSDFLRSPRLAVKVQPGKNVQDLALAKSGSLPETIVLRFDATQDQVVTLADGAQVVIPAGAMATSGYVTLVVRPLAKIADDGVAAPVSFGYRLLAFDDSNVPVDHFNAPVTLRMPFTVEQLADLGVGPDQLIPSYWDVATDSWKPAPNYSLITNPDGSGSLNLSVDHFTDYSVLGSTSRNLIYLPAIRQH